MIASKLCELFLDYFMIGLVSALTGMYLIDRIKQKRDID